MARTSRSAAKSVSLGGTNPIDQLTESVSKGELVAVVGTGVSMALTDGASLALSWKGLIENGFTYGVRKGKISADQATAWKRQLDSSDLDDLLAAAEFVGRKLGAPTGDLYARWFASVFEAAEPTNDLLGDAIRQLVTAGVPVCTLNYDTLLERVTALPAINLHETGKVTAWMRGTSPGILHLHGIWDTPNSCILGIRDYDSTLRDDVRDHFQRSLASFRRLLFIGCGDTFADPNFVALITWLRIKLKTATLQHYALVRDDEVARRDADPAWHGFVEPIGYGAEHDDLPRFIVDRLITKSSNAKRAIAREKKTGGIDDQERLLAEYRSFLLKDCGQITIEGVRADMDTAQRRFDLERLFVPLKVIPSPPDIAENDPFREEKLRRWHKKQQKPQTFGKVFAKRNRLALLALPGGGKTLLLKRLAVAYADSARRTASADALPNLELTPVLIRCREWREHIHRPILTLLRNLPDITGHVALVGISDALLPLFQQGKILLLIDGLDEIHDDALRSTFVEHLEKFLDEYPNTRLIVTSREAGFSLVAPVLARFCDRWRVAPLEEEAIKVLCDHWHHIMTGDSPEARAEANEVSQYLIRNDSLRRLAENPLLLTMLLVVKHGAGRLPPDRVSLYGRAVEVLLDTWNIKGHAPLNPKEAVPQLAYVAFELMRAGKQTATERELLLLLEEARENVPQIRRYAKDSPHDFLKRVELRSSLLMEAGHQVEGKVAVPFYQFRHLTFQEYLSGVAITEGHYREYSKSDNLLIPLFPYLVAEEWKEVIPMAAVLARKQAEPLLAILVMRGNELLREMVAQDKLRSTQGSEDLIEFGAKVPAPISRLISCLVEEAEASSETLTGALRVVAFFAYGCQSKNEDWAALSRGLYGEELLHQAWLLYQPMDWPEQTLLLNSCAQFAWLCRPRSYWSSSEGIAEVQTMLFSSEAEEIARGFFTLSGYYWSRTGTVPLSQIEALMIQPIIEKHLLLHEDPAVTSAAIWAWALSRYYGSDRSVDVKPAVLDRLLTVLLSPTIHPATRIRSAFALGMNAGRSRDSWKPRLTKAQVQQIKRISANPNPEAMMGVLVVGFHARNVWTNRELAELMAKTENLFGPQVNTFDTMLAQLGNVGRTYLKNRPAR